MGGAGGIGRSLQPSNSCKGACGTHSSYPDPPDGESDSESELSPPDDTDGESAKGAELSHPINESGCGVNPLQPGVVVCDTTRPSCQS